MKENGKDTPVEEKQTLKDDSAVEERPADEEPPQTEPTELQERKNDKRSKILHRTVYFLVLNLGVFLLSFGVYMFEVPNNFAMGGVGGISIVVAPYLSKLVPWLTQPVILGILNALLLVIGLIFLGKSMTIKTLYCTAMYSFEVWLFSYIHPMNAPLTNQPLLELVYAVVIMGSGSALIYNCRASSGGSDIIALIVKKYTGLHIGSAVLASDMLIACLSFLFGPEAGLYSILGLFVKTFVIDGVIDNITKTKYVTIITSNPDMVSELILKYINRGFTSYDAKGGYTGEHKTVIITVCKRSQAMRLKMKLHEVDPASFVIITNANEILGKGFSERL